MSAPRPPSAEWEVNVTHLEMRARAFLQVKRPFQSGMLIRLRDPTVSFYRYLLDSVGRGRMWPERRSMTDAQLAEILQDDGVEVVLLSLGGVPAGFFEIDARLGGDVILARVGVVPEFTGRGLGRYLVAAAVEAAWAHDPEVVRAETSDLDDPHSLLLYQWAGFVPVRSERRRIPI